MSEAVQQPDRKHQDHQPEQTRIGTILLIAGGLLVLVVVAQLALWLFFQPLPIQPSSLQPSEITAGPRLQIAPAGDLDQLRASKQALLRSYGWVDREEGLIRIPIERAMELLVERQQANPSPGADHE